MINYVVFMNSALILTDSPSLIIFILRSFCYYQVMNLGVNIRFNKAGIFAVICILIILFYYMGSKDYSSELQTVNLRRLLLASIDAAERGGREVIKAKKNPSIELSKGKTKEGANIPVTEADYNSHCAMYYGIKKLFPQIKVISEEKRDQQKCNSELPEEVPNRTDLGLEGLADKEVDAARVSVWIDPLDATKEFTENLLDYVTTMVCVAFDDNPVIGVIHKPFHDPPETVWAWLNRGQSPLPSIQPPQKTNIEKIIVSRSHAGKVESIIKHAFGDNAEIIKAGGSGYKVMELLKGNATIYVHLTEIHKWDICAGDAILTALGGRMSTVKNEDISYLPFDSSNKEGVIATTSAKADYHSSYSSKISSAIKSDLP